MPHYPLLSQAAIVENWKRTAHRASRSYLAMYSSWHGGITTDPYMMLVPIDDHMVHRGDGVFEALQLYRGRIYLLEEHLERLEHSLQSISLSPSFTMAEIRTVLMEVSKAAVEDDCLLRLYVSRGPGGFSVNAAESIGAQLYVVATRHEPPPRSMYDSGVRIGRSAIPAKEPWFARIKSCNYLHNVLMKKEAVERGLDFTVAFDKDDFLTESATENIVIVTQAGIIARPFLHSILRGTTMLRALELAEQLVDSGLLQGIEERNLTETDLQNALEVLVVGTSWRIIPAVEYEGQPVGDGKPGEVSKKLLALVNDDILRGPKSVAVT